MDPSQRNHHFCYHRIHGENWTEEYDAFRSELHPVVELIYAEYLLHPLERDCIELADVPDSQLTEIFTLPRLKAIFHLVLREMEWSTQQTKFLSQELRPAISAVTQTTEAGSLRLDIRIDGQHPGARPGAWYETPRLHLLIIGQDFVVSYG